MFIHIGINAPRAHAEGWGDTQYAEGLARAIRQMPGCNAGLLFRGEVPALQNGPAVLLRILGPYLEDPVPGLPNLIWMISPPNLAPSATLARFQAVLCGSAALTRLLQAQGVQAHYLPQATTGEMFHPDRHPAGADEIPLAFVGAHAPRAPRRIVLDAIEAGFEPQIWGPGWEGVVPERLWHGARLEINELAEVYARARVVLNSHMGNMAAMGFMSNRSYDAMAAGARVVSDPVAGFSAPDLPELVQVSGKAALTEVLAPLLSGPPPPREARLALHQRTIACHGFAARAQVIVATARQVWQTGARPEPAFWPGRALPTAAPSPPQLSDPAESDLTTAAAVLNAAEEMLAICRYLEHPAAPPLPPPIPAVRQGVIHPLMADLRAMQALACAAPEARPATDLEGLAAQARRLAEALRPALPTPLALDPQRKAPDHLLERIGRNLPLWHSSPEGFDRDGGKVNLPLWPRQQPPKTFPGVFLHLYHADLAPLFAERLQQMPCDFGLYVSTDTVAKAETIRAALPQAEIRVLENRGRDIWPKLYGFRDAHARHDIVLHLHGKKSLHSGKLDDWLAHILTCLMGSQGEIARILSFFDSIPRLGMVMPGVFRNVLSAAHWGGNRDIARELAHRMGLRDPLPPDNALRFPVGSMFWARSAALKPLLDLDLQPQHFPPEAGQVDGTLAHAIERMLGVTCRAGGYHLLPVLGAESRLHLRFQKQARSNGALRKALEEGAFDG